VEAVVLTYCARSTCKSPEALYISFHSLMEELYHLMIFQTGISEEVRERQELLKEV